MAAGRSGRYWHRLTRNTILTILGGLDILLLLI
jgi:hypothetical protein